MNVITDVVEALVLGAIFKLSGSSTVHVNEGGQVIGNVRSGEKGSIEPYTFAKTGTGR